MSQWDIDPSGVKSVLQRTETTASAFEEQIRSLNTALEQAGTESTSRIVAKAISDFMQAQATHMTFVFTRTSAALQGAANATQAYLDGDLQMAANAQQSAATAPVPTDIPGAAETRGLQPR